MTFRAPDLLFLLLLVPAAAGLLVLAWRRRLRATQRFGAAATVQGLVVGEAGRLRATRAVLFVLALACALIALAGPQIGSRTRVLHKRGVDLVIALDFSKSMLARDARPDRIERAKQEIVHLLGELDGDRVGVVAFAGETMEFPMTNDYRAIGLFLRDLGPYDMPVGGTAIGRALTATNRLLARARPEGARPEARPPAQVVLLITDGEDHEGDPVAAARELAEAGARIFVLGVGSRSGEPIPTYAPDGTWTGYMRDDQGRVVTTALTTENERQLREIARVGQGRYYRAREGTVSLAPLRRELRQLQAAERRSRHVLVREDRYALFLLPAFLLLVLEGLLPEAVRRRRRAVAEGAA